MSTDDPRTWPCHAIGTDPMEQSEAGMLALSWAAAMLNPKDLPCTSATPAPAGTETAPLNQPPQSMTVGNTERKP